MKKTLIVFLLTFKVLYSQTDTTITQLRGMEDNQGVTHLIYQINYRHLGIDLDYIRSDYYILNTSTNETKLLFNDYSNITNTEDPFSEIFSEHIKCFSFFGNDPNKFIYANNVMFTDPGCEIVRYDQGQVYSNTNNIQALQISREDSNKVFAVQEKMLIKSNDAGYTWTDWSDTTTTQLDFQFLSFCPYDDSLIFGKNYDGKPVRSTDAGSTFEQVLDEYWWKDTKLYFDKDETHIYSLSGTYVWISDEKGKPNSWQYLEIGSWRTKDLKKSVTLDDSGSGAIYVAAGRELYVSNNYGTTFDLVHKFSSVITGLYKKPGSDTIYISFVNRILKYDFTSQSEIKKYTIEKALEHYPLNTGDSWFYFYYGASYSDWHLPGDSYSGYFRNTVIGDTILDNGIKYKVINSLSNRSELFFKRVDSVRGIVYAKDQYQDEGVLYDLLAISGDLYEIPSIGEFNDILMNDTLLWGEKRNVKEYFYGSLQIMNQSLAQGIGLIYQHDEYDFGYTYYLLLGCVINGVLYGDTTTVGLEPITEDLPTDFILYQNYPNPFNPTTTISYFIPRESQIRLIIYDVLGNRIKTLVNEIKTPGYYEIKFNAASLTNEVSSGVYFYTLEFGGQIISKKMLLIK